MDIIPVSTALTRKQFLDLPAVLFKDDPNYIKPLDKDVEAVFDRKTNKAYRFGDTRRWLLRDSQGNTIGRVAAFTNSKYKNKGDKWVVGGMGFFDCVNDQAAANALFDVAKSWLAGQGVEAMDGPINFGERDRFWGLVVEGFDPPIYLMNYNPPYYRQLFENYGFQLFYKQLIFKLSAHQQLSENFVRMNAKYESDPAFEARHLRKDQLRKYAHDFVEVYNKAWAGHQGNKEMSPAVALKMFESMKPVMDEKLIWFVYHNDKPVACWLNLPELNRWFKYLSGKFGLMQKLFFLLLRKLKKNPRFTGIVFGVVPEYQGKGIDYFMIMQGAKVIQTQTNYETLELQWMGDFNPKMVNIAVNLGATVSRTLVTYRYLFDREAPFERHPIL